LNLFTSEPNPPATAAPAPRDYVRRPIAPSALLIGSLVLFVVFSGFAIAVRTELRGTFVAVARPQHAAARAIAYRTIDDDPDAGTGSSQFFYTGSWQHVRGRFDGRSHGTSSRSFRVGSEASFPFRGERFEIFGIRGPNGGYASVLVDGSPAGTISFFAKHKQVSARVYASSKLDEGAHEVQIDVITPPNGSAKRRFVNIDGAAIGS
jgi:hypothetical protein